MNTFSLQIPGGTDWERDRKWKREAKAGVGEAERGTARASDVNMQDCVIAKADIKMQSHSSINVQIWNMKKSMNKDNKNKDNKHNCVQICVCVCLCVHMSVWVPGILKVHSPSHPETSLDPQKAAAISPVLAASH